jgi:hypothetical protein
MPKNDTCEGVWQGGNPCSHGVSSIVSVPRLKQSFSLCSLHSCGVQTALHSIGIAYSVQEYDGGDQRKLFVKSY